MTTKRENIVLIRRGVLYPWSIDVSSLFNQIEGWANVSRAGLVNGWTEDEIGACRPDACFFLVGCTASPPWLLEQSCLPVDAASLLPWMAGDQAINLTALIRAAIAEADLANAREKVLIQPCHRVLLVGAGPAAEQLARALNHAAIPLLWAIPVDIPTSEYAEIADVEIVPCQELLLIKGFAGRFTAVLDTGQGERHVDAAGIVFCGPEYRQSRSQSEFAPNQSVSLSSFEKMLDDGHSEWMEREDFRVVFLTGASHPTSNNTMKRVMEAACRTASVGKAAVYLLAPQIKAAEKKRRTSFRSSPRGWRDIYSYLRTPIELRFILRWSDDISHLRPGGSGRFEAQPGPDGSGRTIASGPGSNRHGQ